MLKIKVGTEYLDMGNFSVSFELLSPVFNDIGSFSYPFTLPATAKNKQVLGFPAKVNYSNFTTQKVAVELYLKGLFWKRGNLVVTEANKDSIRANFTVSEGYFYSTIKDLKLADLDLGGIRLFIDNPWESYFDKTYPETDFILFPLYMPRFYGEINSNAKSIKLNHDLLNNGFVGKINYWDGNEETYNLPGNTFVLFPFLNYVLDRLFEHINIAVTKNPFSENEFLMKLVLFNMISESYTEEDISGGDELGSFNLKDYVPDLTVSEFFDYLQSLFKTFVFYDDFKNEISIQYLKDIINNPDTLTLSGAIRYNYLKPNDYDGYLMTYGIDGDDNLAELHYKDISGYTFLGNLPNLAALPANGTFLDLYYIEDIHKYYYYEINYTGMAGTFVVLSDDVLTDQEGNGALEIEIPGVFARDEINHASCGNTGHWQIKEKPFEVPDRPEPRLMFWHGSGVNSNNIPFGSPFNLWPNGAEAAPYSIEWGSAAGLKENFHKEFLEFKKTTREAEISMILKASDLKNIDFSRKYRFSEANWLLSSIKFTVTNDKITPATIVAFKV